jgi:hypothetical protein
MPHNATNRRDANEREIVDLWRAAGCLWIQQPRESGFDGILLCPRTGLHVVEIKRCDIHWKLTPHEREVCQEVERRGQAYSIITNLEQAQDLIGVGG